MANQIEFPTVLWSYSVNDVFRCLESGRGFKISSRICSPVDGVGYAIAVGDRVSTVTESTIDQLISDGWIKE